MNPTDYLGPHGYSYHDEDQYREFPNDSDSDPKIHNPEPLRKHVDPETVNEMVAVLAETSSPSVVSAAYLYDRKGYSSTDNLGSVRNGSYGHDSDDLLVQVTYRVSRHGSPEAYEKLREIDAVIVEKVKAENKAAAEAQVAKLERELAEARAKIEANS